MGGWAGSPQTAQVIGLGPSDAAAHWLRVRAIPSLTTQDPATLKARIWWIDGRQPSRLRVHGARRLFYGLVALHTPPTNR